MTKKKNLRKYVIAGAVLWGAILAFFGVIHGNQSLVTPDLYEHEKAVLADSARVELLTCDAYQKRTKFQLVEFAGNKNCMASAAGFSNYACHDLNDLKNAKWVREQFRRLNREIITFSNNRENSIYAAAMLHYYGYNVKILENASAIDFVALNQPEQGETVEVEEIVTPVSLDTDEETETAEIEVAEVETVVTDSEDEEEFFEEEGC